MGLSSCRQECHLTGPMAAREKNFTFQNEPPKPPKLPIPGFVSAFSERWTLLG